MANEAIALQQPLMPLVNGATGAPYASGSVGLYTVGTTTPLNVYSDIALTVALPNPVPLNASGYTSTSTTGTPTPVYLQQTAYDYYLFDATSATVLGPVTISGSAWPGQVQGIAVLSPAANANGYANRFQETINKASTGTHALFAGVRLDAPTIGAGASTLTEATTLYITGAPSSGTNQYALHVAGGATQFDGAVTFGGGVTFGGSVFAPLCQGRLTLTSGVPVTSTDVAGATTIYFTPYDGGSIALYDGTANWNLLTFTEQSINLGTLSSSTVPFDIFAFNNGGVIGIDAPLAWATGTVRATNLALQNGVYVKAGATTRRYLGTFMPTSTTTTEDSQVNRFLWNYYNRVRRGMARNESTATWTYSTATVRQANASSPGGGIPNQLSVVVGVAEVIVNVTLLPMPVVNNSTSATIVNTGIGVDSTSSFTVQSYLDLSGSAAVVPVITGVTLTHIPGIGKHFYSWNEYSQANPTTTWYGATSFGAGMVTTGLYGFVDA